MSWVRRVLTDTEDDGRFRSGLGIIAGASFVILPLLFGKLDTETVLVAALIGAIVVAPAWRVVGEPVSSPFSIISYAAFLIASVIILRLLPGLACFVFLGGFTFTLSLLRFVNGWRNPVHLPSETNEPGPIQPGLVLVLVVPLLALLALIVIVIAVEPG